MTREQAEAECKRLAEESPERETHQWLPREEDDGSWSVVKVSLAPSSAADLTAETRADEKPPTPDDPRSAPFRNIGPPYG
jgi:hypothetical protein